MMYRVTGSVSSMTDHYRSQDLAKHESAQFPRLSNATTANNMGSGPIKEEEEDLRQEDVDEQMFVFPNRDGSDGDYEKEEAVRPKSNIIADNNPYSNASDSSSH